MALKLSTTMIIHIVVVAAANQTKEINVEPIFDLESLREELDSEEWEDDSFLGDSQTRRVYLGTVFSLLPSGKYYTPWANSNVSGCHCCHGKGTIPGHPNARVRKRNKSRYEKMLGLAQKLGPEYAVRHADVRLAARDRFEKTCPVCHGVGSKEAYLDECWYEQAEEELDSIGCSLDAGEGDPCDLFAVEYRDVPEEDDEEAA